MSLGLAPWTAHEGYFLSERDSGLSEFYLVMNKLTTGTKAEIHRVWLTYDLDKSTPSQTLPEPEGAYTDPVRASQATKDLKTPHVTQRLAITVGEWTHLLSEDEEPMKLNHKKVVAQTQMQHTLAQLTPEQRAGLGYSDKPRKASPEIPKLQMPKTPHQMPNLTQNKSLP